jgi:hypothetical protein
MKTKLKEIGFKDFVVMFNKTEIELSTLKYENGILRSELDRLKKDLVLSIHKHNENSYTMIPLKRITKKEYSIFKDMLKQLPRDEK